MWSPIAPPTTFSNLPQIQNPTQQAPDGGTQLNALANSASERQLQAQQTQDLATQNQANQIAVQQAQQDYQDQQTFRQLYQQNKGDMGATMAAATKAGVGPRTLQPILTSIQTYQQGQAKLTEEQKAIQDANTNGMHALMVPVQGMKDPAAQKVAFEAAIQTAVKSGYMTPVEATQHPYPGGPDGVDSYVNGLNTLGWMKEDAANKKDVAAAAESAQKTSDLKRASAIQSLTALANPTTGQVNPADFTKWQTANPDIQLAAGFVPDKAGLASLSRSEVPAEKRPEYDLSQLKLQNGVVGNDKFETVFLPAYAANLGKTVATLTPTEKMASFTAFKQYDTNPEMLQSILASREATQAFHAQTLQNVGFQRGQQSYQFSSGQLERLATPIDASVQRFSRLQDTLNQNSPQADALVAPELLSVMAGGQGSGLRMNEAEISRIVGGRSNWQSLQASINKWQLDPKQALSITPEQRQEIRALATQVGQKLTQKQNLINDARTQLTGSNDPMEHRTIMSNVHNQLTGVDAGVGGQNPNPSGGSGYVRTSTGSGGHQIGQTSDGKWHDVMTGAVIQ
jgi:hypothetical protein